MGRETVQDRREISSKICLEIPADKKRSHRIDIARAQFLVKKRLIGMTGIQRLGLLSVIIEPIIGSFVFLGVIWLISGSPGNAISLFLGFGLLGGFNAGLNVAFSSDFNDGGLNIERTSTRAIIYGFILELFVFSTLSVLGAIFVCVFLGAPFYCIPVIVIANFVFGIITYSFSSPIRPFVIRFPDVKILQAQIHRIFFFGSPILYPMDVTSGIHRDANLLNPLVYFLEPIREISSGNSSIELLIPEVALFYLLISPILFYRALSRFDIERWRWTTWS